MSASERDVPQRSRTATEQPGQHAGPGEGDRSGIAVSGLSMSELLASCAAASAVSTPPTEGEGEERRDAA